MKPEKVKKNPRDYAPWAGWFADPKLDPELYASLPGYRQRQAAFGREQREQGRQPTLDEILRAGAPEPVAALPVSLSSMFTLRSIKSRQGGVAPSPGTLTALRSSVTPESLIAHCTLSGEGLQLLIERPAQGLYGYLWTLTQVRRKSLPSLPLPAFLELEEGIQELTGEVTSTRVEAAKPLLKWLDGLADSLAANVA